MGRGRRQRPGRLEVPHGPQRRPVRRLPRRPLTRESRGLDRSKRQAPLSSGTHRPNSHLEHRILHRHSFSQPAETSAQSAFDALYTSAAPALVQQAYVLTGCRRLAFESTEQAFHRAWERWPDVVRDPDPEGWVRAQTHDYALSPWHRLRRLRPAPQPADPVLRAFLELPPWQRRAALLRDGLELSVEEVAAETEATVAATDSRLRHARAGIVRYLPEASADTDTDTDTDTGNDAARHALRMRVKDVSVATLAHPRSVRAAGEFRVRTLTRVVFAVTAVLIGAVTATTATTPAHEEPGFPPARSER
ncbi:sigma factor-like helix-turn-helix DNA-binding protein [Streptomyces sp. NPDC096205]|uniref:sigma factor-like helix-turn-helix DNA-binding protein n=1 Tax=Streptomyces sp. NPDC096205 TaxID=3366081 RepID=UPI00380D9847